MDPDQEKSIPEPLCLHWGSVVRGMFKCLTVHTPEHAQLPPGSEMSRQVLFTGAFRTTSWMYTG